MYFHYQVTFTGYIRCFCATTSRDLDLDLLTLIVFHVHCLSCPTHIPILIILRLSVTELWITEFDHISVIGNSHCACAVLRDLSMGQNGPHLWNAWPQFTYSLCHFHGATTKIKPCYCKNIIYTIVKATKFTTKYPKTTLSNFLTANYLFTIQL